MTVSTSTSRVAYAGDSATVSFAIPFVFLEDAHITALLRDSAGSETAWEAGTHYSLSGAGNEAGGTLTVLTTPTDFTPTVGETLVIRRVVEITQGTDYPEGGEFPAKAHEQALDKLTMIAHQHAERLDRSLQVPASDTATSLDLPNESTRAGKFLAFDGSGNPIVAAGTSADLTPVSAFMNTLLDDADAATARTTLQALTDVLTARGDIPVEGAGGPTRLAVGAADTWLKSDGTDPAWSALPKADETTEGMAEIASQAEMESASANDRIVTPAVLHLHPMAPKAVIKAALDSSSPSIISHNNNGGGTPTISRTSSGNFSVGHGLTFSSTDYYPTATYLRDQASGLGFVYCYVVDDSSIQVNVRDHSGSGVDAGEVAIVVWGGL